MGEVYRAYDSRLDREVAIKILPADVADNPDRLGRFEQEARAVARLSHPNILTLHDFGRADGISYAVMELLDGETLRARLDSGALPLRKAAEIGTQTARGLAAAHDKHIVHRDLKPENLFITADGQVRILDFGLARRNDPIGAASTSVDSPTMARGTEPGVVLGTVGYMAPEQVKGEPVDNRTDIFALGCVLYEMFSGRRAFAGDSAPETLTAILKQDPPDPTGFGVTVPPAVLRIVRRCLEKRPEERFQSARDLAFALESALDASHPSGPSPVLPRRPSARRLVPFALLGIGLIAGTLIGARFLGSKTAAPSGRALPTFRQLTFERGTIRDARFTPDGQSVLYGAAWEGNPLRVFMTRTDAQDSVKLPLPDARLLSISRTGELAISLGHTFIGWMGEGSLARSSMLGTAPRVLAERVREAEWTPDGTGLAIVRAVAGLEQLEFPVGKPLYKTAGFIRDVRFSPDGERIAFTDHPVFADDAGGVSIVNRAGERTQLSTGYSSIRGLAWFPDGKEIWYTARTGEMGVPALLAVTLTAQIRTVWSSPSAVQLFDIGADGRVLLSSEVADRRVEALFAGRSLPEDVSLRAQSSSQWIADDGTVTMISDQAAPPYQTYLVRPGSAAVRLGDGQAYGQSRDGRWAIGLPVTGSPILIHPTGAGETRTLPNPDQLVFRAAAWLPDSRRIVAFGSKVGELTRGFVQDIDGGAPRAFTAEGVDSPRWWSIPVSPDGTRVTGQNADGVMTIYRIDNGSGEPVPGLQAQEIPVQWTEDGRGLLVARGGGLPWVIERLDLASGRRTPVREIRAHDAAGLRISIIALTPDGRHYVHSYSRLLTDLFVVDGLR